MSSKFNQHFNGNAIYGVGAPGFIEFLNSWEHVLKMCIPNANWLAYDIAIEWARSSLFELESGLSNDQIISIESLVEITEGMLVDISNLIRNVSGTYETSNDFIDFDAISDSVIICHSRPLSKIIPWVFRNDSLNREIFHFQSPLSRRVEALKAGIPQYLNFPDSQTFQVRLLIILFKNNCIRNFTPTSSFIGLALFLFNFNYHDERFFASSQPQKWTQDVLEFVKNSEKNHLDSAVRHKSPP